MSGQIHIPAPLPKGKELPVPTGQEGSTYIKLYV